MICSGADAMGSSQPGGVLMFTALAPICASLLSWSSMKPELSLLGQGP